MAEEKYNAGLIKTVTRKNDNFQFGPNPTTSCFYKHDSSLLSVGFNDEIIII